MAKKINDLTKLCIHTMTNRPWSIEECIKNYSEMGIGGISVWRNVLVNKNLNSVEKDLKNSGLKVVSLVRGGFFTASSLAERNEAIKENKRAIDEAQGIGAGLLVLVCGATPGFTIKENLSMIRDGIEAILPHAMAAGVKLGIEPLHPMYADTRSAVCSLSSANRLVSNIASPFVGVTIDVFHLWWEEFLEEEIAKCGEMEKIFSFHICDWKMNMSDMLNDRGLMGDGIINIPQIRGWVEKAGFKGFNEVEIFSEKYWKMDQKEFLKLITQKYITKS